MMCFDMYDAGMPSKHARFGHIWPTPSRDLARIWIVGCPKWTLEETGCPGERTQRVRCGRSKSERLLRPGVWGPLKGPRSQRV